MTIISVDIASPALLDEDAQREDGDARQYITEGYFILSQDANNRSQGNEEGESQRQPRVNFWPNLVQHGSFVDTRWTLNFYRLRNLSWINRRPGVSLIAVVIFVVVMIVVVSCISRLEVRRRGVMRSWRLPTRDAIVAKIVQINDAVNLPGIDWSPSRGLDKMQMSSSDCLISWDVIGWHLATQFVLVENRSCYHWSGLSLMTFVVVLTSIVKWKSLP